jgi:hypothetical protein
MLETPISIFIFNRPDLTAKVFERIKQVKPKTLLIVADGPRMDKAGEIEKCQKARIVTEEVDWDCEVFRNYSEVNLSSGLRVSSGLDWVFEQVDRAIILEDDCLPNLDFFRFCEELLEKYQDSEQVSMISGTNFLSGVYTNPQSYYFSCLPAIWGWATWRRSWMLYDYKMNLFPIYAELNFLDHIFSDPGHQKFWYEILRSTYEAKNKITWWDYQWAFAQWINGGVSIIPKVNLVSNIGYRGDATHTKRKSKISNLPVLNIDFPLTHPKIISRNLKMDDLMQRKIYMRSLSHQILKKIISYLIRS